MTGLASREAVARCVGPLDKDRAIVCGLRRGAASLDLYHLGSSASVNVTLKEH